MLSFRLQKELSSIIQLDQTGFLKGRHISETFIHATELVQCCHKRKAPAVILKLDFAKAFDSVQWDSLHKILYCRGFNDSWNTCIKMLLASARSSIILNGVPGNWISCKQGLRQGDPLSPYLFIIVADVLQTLIRKSQLRHPLNPQMTPSTLQYADDTLIICKASSQDVALIKRILDDFSSATGLEINYSKSTMVCIHVPPEDQVQLANVLGCRLENFPQTYLGLLLSTTKLNFDAFAPVISRVDRFLASWQASLLNYADRIILINAILSSLPTYAMAAMELPKGVFAAIDKRRRAFLWTGDDSCSGSKCLVSWDEVCTDKKFGGLGIKDLAKQNSCLLLKTCTSFTSLLLLGPSGCGMKFLKTSCSLIQIGTPRP